MNSALIHTSLFAHAARHVYTPQTSCPLIILQCHPRAPPLAPPSPEPGSFALECKRTSWVKLPL